MFNHAIITTLYFQMELSIEKSSSPSARQTTDGSSTKDRKSAKPSKVTKQQAYQMIAMYENPRHRVEDIAKHFGVSVPSLYWYMDRSGVAYQRRGKPAKHVSVKQSAQIRSLALSGINRDHIAQHMGLSPSTVYRHMQGHPATKRAAIKKVAPVVQKQQPEVKIETPAVIEKPTLLQRLKRWFAV